MIKVSIDKAKEFINLLTQKQLVDNIVCITKHEDDPILDYTIELEDEDKSILEYKFV